MSDFAIRVENLGKKYIISHERNSGYKTLRDTIVEKARKTVGILLHPFSAGESETEFEEFWALKDIELEIKSGERIGIIGRNGAGKSTLLKILSRITEPTVGDIWINGRVASLLEVGTGFHPELTGRENIFLNGAVLGMSKAEIKRKFDEIVAFSEVEKFLDTPVKRYSSGMYVRLAFAVAAHLEPEILVVDEVLAVGDAAFQKKCLGKMEAVGKEGRTVLFVSHNMAAIQQLCSKSVWLDRGGLKMTGSAHETIKSYMSEGFTSEASVDLQNYPLRKGNQKFSFVSALLQDDKGMICKNFSIGDEITLKYRIRKKSEFGALKLAVEIKSEDGIAICNMVDSDSKFSLSNPRESEEISVVLKDIRLYPGTYYFSLWMGGSDSVDIFDYVENCLSFNITDGGRLTSRKLPRSAGIFFFSPDWQRHLEIGKDGVVIN